MVEAATILFNGEPLITEESKFLRQTSLKNPETSQSNKDILDQIMLNAKEFGSQTMIFGAEITRKIDESGFKEKIADGTQKIIDSSKQLSTDAIQAASSTLN